MLDALLGYAAELEVLKGVLIDRTQGRPLFVEELVRSLKDTGIISGSEGLIELTGNLDRIEIPGSVQDVIASRIDRLEPELKGLLQTASVIGRRVPVALLKSISESTASEVDHQLAQLQAMEFLYETGGGNSSEFFFKHALTEEVTYASLVHETRTSLHGRLVDAIEIEYADRLEENYEVVARHAVAAERWAQAFDYSLKAARKAHARSAYQAAIEWFDKAVEALDHLPETEDRLIDKMDVRLEMRIALWPLGQHELLARRVREAGALAERAGDTLRLAIVHNYLTAHHWQAGEHEEAIKIGEKGIALAEQADDFSVLTTTKQHLGLALLARGEYARQTKLHHEVVQSLDGKHMLQRHGMAGYPAALSRGFLAYGLTELGEFQEAFRWAREGVEIAHQVNSAMTTVWVTNNLALTHLMMGEPEKSLELMQPNFALCCKSEVKLLFSQTAGILGHTLTIAGRPLESAKVLEQATHPDNLAHHTEGMGYPIVWLALAMLASDRLDEGLDHAHRALDIASKQGERGHKAWALFARAEIEDAAQHPVEQTKETYKLALQIADTCEMRPLAALCQSRLNTN
jgi:tetratricopeptide (TPR) repeat protein